MADEGSARLCKGYVTDHRAPLNDGEVDVYLCGPPPMVASDEACCVTGLTLPVSGGDLAETPFNPAQDAPGMPPTPAIRPTRKYDPLRYHISAAPGDWPCR